MGRTAFIEPATGVRYDWPRNPTAEDSYTASRVVHSRAPSAAGWEQVAPVRFQGQDRPTVLVYSGRIDVLAQHEAFLRFWRLSASQTVILETCDGARHEVLVKDYKYDRKGVVRNTRGGNYSFDYTLDLEIIN